LLGCTAAAGFWFNNGCDIGSEKCDGVTGQAPGTNAGKFKYTGKGEPPNWGADGIEVDPATPYLSKRIPRPKFLKYPERKATNCDPRARTINVNAECGSPEDFYYFMPWRYPGITPVTDSCGVAGGIVPGQPKGTAGADYTETPLAKLGDLGSKLPPMPTGTVWTAGGTAEVGWTLKAWHGGGCVVATPGRSADAHPLQAFATPAVYTARFHSAEFSHGDQPIPLGG
jgi:hypothetical protein